MQCQCWYRTGALPCKLRVVGLVPRLGLDVFNLLFLHFSLSLTLVMLSLHWLCVYPGVYAHLWQSPACLSGGPSSTIDVPVVIYTLLMAVQLTFDFEVQLLRSIYQKNRQAMRSFWSKNLRNWHSKYKVIPIFPSAK